MNTSTVELPKYLGDIDYPATKQDILKVAKNHKAPQEIMSLLHGIADREYDSLTEVEDEMNKRMK